VFSIELTDDVELGLASPADGSAAAFAVGFCSGPLDPLAPAMAELINTTAAMLAKTSTVRIELFISAPSVVASQDLASTLPASAATLS
jgi:hypothetical protein